MKERTGQLTGPFKPYENVLTRIDPSVGSRTPLKMRFGISTNQQQDFMLSAWHHDEDGGEHKPSPSFQFIINGKKFIMSDIGIYEVDDYMSIYQIKFPKGADSGTIIEYAY